LDDAATVVLDPVDLSAEVDDARRVLFEAREGRVRPATDDKVLAAWNGMAIAALAEAGRALGEPAYAAAASRGATFVLEHLRGSDGRLTGLAQRSRGPKFADDHALMASACLTLARPRSGSHGSGVLELTDDLRRLFADRSGVASSDGSDAETLVVRRALRRHRRELGRCVPSARGVTADGDLEADADAMSGRG
jgi:uncharacterized protein YyaL (SSP411 family)